ncbi:hypothetical protein JVU11DRAFT_3881 [Chiua virens]|nr:hypothetical protein JVU11DRAFT_3881 [Chiua virens]
MSTFNPPLLGDGHGNYRIHLIGNSGTGKSTLAAYLSAKLDLPHISLDGLAWNPGWKRLKNDEFKAKVSVLMAQSTRGWISGRKLHWDVGNADQLAFWIDDRVRSTVAPLPLSRSMAHILAHSWSALSMCRRV